MVQACLPPGGMATGNLPASTDFDPKENLADGEDVLTFHLDIVPYTYIVWLKGIHIFRDAIVHIMDNAINLLKLKENLELADSPVCSSYLFLFYTND